MARWPVGHCAVAIRIRPPYTSPQTPLRQLRPQRLGACGVSRVGHVSGRLCVRSRPALCCDRNGLPGDKATATGNETESRGESPVTRLCRLPLRTGHVWIKDAASPFAGPGGAPEFTHRSDHSIRSGRSARHLHRSSARSKPRRAGSESRASIGRSQAVRPNGHERPSAAWPVRNIRSGTSGPCTTSEFSHRARCRRRSGTTTRRFRPTPESGFSSQHDSVGMSRGKPRRTRPDRTTPKSPRCGAAQSESITRAEPGRDPAAHREPGTSDGTDANDRHTGSIESRKGLRHTDAPDCNG